MRLRAAAEETYCLKTQIHVETCVGSNHICYRCGLLLGKCNCPELGTPFDY